jgi:hypothetical protein
MPKSRLIRFAVLLLGLISSTTTWADFAASRDGQTPQQACVEWNKPSTTSVTPFFSGYGRIGCKTVIDGQPYSQDWVTETNCPAHAHGTQMTTCACDDGYRYQGNECVVPASDDRPSDEKNGQAVADAKGPPDGQWRRVERWKGEWLIVQSVVSGQTIFDGGAEHAMIQEYYLDGGEFDGYRNGRLIEVKGDYEGFGWKIAEKGRRAAAAEMRKKEQGFRAQAKKLVETAAKYKLTPVYVVKKNQIDYWTGLLGVDFPTIVWEKWDRAPGKKIVYPAR